MSKGIRGDHYADGELTRPLHLRVPVGMRPGLRQRAKRDGLTRSDACRLSIERALATPDREWLVLERGRASQRLGFLVTPDLYGALRDKAAKAGISVSATARMALAYGLRSTTPLSERPSA